jgi:hypothetical protein
MFVDTSGQKKSQNRIRQFAKLFVAFITSCILCGFFFWGGGGGANLNKKKFYLRKINSRLNSGNACYLSVQNILSSSLLSKKYTVLSYVEP